MKKNIVLLTPLVFFSVLIFFGLIYEIPVKSFHQAVLGLAAPLFHANFIPYSRLRLNNPTEGIDFYLICILTVCIVVLILFLYSRFSKYKKSFDLRGVISICIVLVILFLGIRSMAQFQFVKKFFTLCLKNSQEHKLEMVYGSLYTYVQEVKKLLPERTRAVLVTDDFDTEAMLTTLRLAYFLYPVDIRKIRDGDVEAYLLYNKKNAERFIPDGFSMIKKLDDRSLISIRSKE